MSNGLSFSFCSSNCCIFATVICLALDSYFTFKLSKDSLSDRLGEGLKKVEISKQKKRGVIFCVYIGECIRIVFKAQPSI